MDRHRRFEKEGTMYRHMLTATATIALLVVAPTAGEARADGYVYGYGPGYHYGGYSYGPATYGPVVVYPAPVYVRPSYYGTPYTVRYRPRETQTKYYTPWGTHEYEVKYDRWGRVRDVDYDFDD
jgi:hypothetical protein